MLKNNKQILSKTLDKCIYFLFKNQKIGTCFLILLMILIGAAPSVNSIFLQELTDQIEAYSDQILQKNIDLVSALFQWIIIYVLWWEGLNILWRIYDYAYLKILPKIQTLVIDEFYDYIQYHEHKFFQISLAGNISNQITEASRALEMIFAHSNERILQKLSVLFFALITLYTVHRYIATIFLVWMIIFVGVSLYFAKTINNYSTIYANNKALVAGKIVDSISNISSIRFFSLYKHERRRLKLYLDKTLASNQNMQWFMLKIRYILGLSCTVMIAFMIYYIIDLCSNLEISIGQAILIISLSVSVIENLWDLSQAFGDLFEQVGSFNQAMNLLNEHGIKDPIHPKSLQIKKPSIEFKNVTFKYCNNDNTFNNQSIIIKPYEKVGLIGCSGSGKTTFAGMISRLYDIEKGSILIDGQDITQISQNNLRNNISIIPQEPILFHRSILENIRYGDPP